MLLDCLVFLVLVLNIICTNRITEGKQLYLNDCTDDRIFLQLNIRQFCIKSPYNAEFYNNNNNNTNNTNNNNNKNK